MKRRSTVAAIDVGSTKVAVIVGDVGQVLCCEVSDSNLQRFHDPVGADAPAGVIRLAVEFWAAGVVVGGILAFVVPGVAAGAIFVAHLPHGPVADLTA